MGRFEGEPPANGLTGGQCAAKILSAHFPIIEFILQTQPISASHARNGASSAQPEILIFDVDGVLVDVRRTYWQAAIDTIRELSGKEVTHEELHEWKRKPGHNDDWRMTSAWATALGRPTTYQEARAVFEKFYWGDQGRPGHVRNEKIIVTARQMKALAKWFELNIFTGRTRREFGHTFDHWPGASQFRTIVTMDDVVNGKPHPEGLLKILHGRSPRKALYLGDNIDDALAARAAGVPFAAILGEGESGFRERAARFAGAGAIALLPRTTALQYLLPTM